MMNSDENSEKKNKLINGMRRNSAKRRLIALLRKLGAVFFALVLVVSDALPVPDGLPNTVEAAGPSKGTVTFYKWTRLRDWEDLDRAYVMLISKIGGKYYMAQSLKDINNDLSNWYLKSIDADPRINPEADEFLTKTCWTNIRTRLTTFNGKYGSFDGYYMEEYYDDAWHWVTHTTEYLKNSTNSATIWIPYDRTMGDSGKGFEMRWGTINNNTVWLKPKDADANWPVRLDWHGWTGPDGCWEVFGRSIKYFTCINSNYTIGENQVYVADSDLFLKEGVKLTIPDGSVLCVKNGPFYVNGEIECYGTILVEDGGIIMPFESTSGGSRIVMKEGSAMIIRSGGRVYAGCPKGSLGTQGDNGWLDMYAGSSIINFGLFVAGKCNFKYGQATIENHKGGQMYLGYAVSTKGESKFMTTGWYGYWDSSSGTKVLNPSADYFGLEKTGAAVYYGEGNNQTIIKAWDGGKIYFANKASSAGKTVKLYTYDKDGKCKIDSNYSPD